MTLQRIWYFFIGRWQARRFRKLGCEPIVIEAWGDLPAGLSRYRVYTLKEFSDE